MAGVAVRPRLSRRRLICPDCLCRFGPEKIKVLDHRGLPVPRRKGPLRRMLGRHDGGHELTRLAESLQVGAYHACPNQHRLPERFVQDETIVVGFVGMTNVSKSHFIASLVHSLLSGALRSYSLVAQVAAESQELYSEVYGPLHDDPDHPRLSLTNPVGTPGEPRDRVVIEVRNTVTDRQYNVLLYDSPGETLRSRQRVGQDNRFLINCDAVMLFVPPAELAPRTARAALGQYPGVTSQMMFAELGRTLAQRPGPPALASVLLCKADELVGQGLDPHLLNDLPYRRLTPRAAYDQVRTHGDQVIEYVEANHGMGLLGTIDNFFDAPTFHAVSATGGPPSGGRYPNLRPARCIDPLFSLFVRRGVIVDDDFRPIC